MQEGPVYLFQKVTMYVFTLSVHERIISSDMI